VRNARGVLPIDIPALVSHNGKVYPNEARPRECLGLADPAPNPLETALDHWLSFATRRNAWISARRQRLLGLVSARRRGGRQAWEIDCLIDTTPARNAVPGLLECAIQGGGRAGAEKIFLRLSASSPLLPIVMNAGFSAYCEERLYVGSALALEAGDVPLRPFSQADQYPAYRLYNCVLPERRRRAESATFGEWQAAQERRWLRGGIELVLDGEGAIAAHVRAARLPQGVLVDVIADQAALVHAPAMIDAAVKAARPPHGPILILVGEHDGGLAARLVELGFEMRDEFFSLMARTTRVARLPKLAPAAIANAAVTT
jgi:hypothetical protein